MKRWLDGVPPAFVVGLAIMVFGGALMSIAWAHAMSTVGAIVDHEKQDWYYRFAHHGRAVLGPGLSLSIASLMILGFAELARRAGPGVDGIALRVGLAAVAALFLAVLANLYATYWYLPRNPGHARSFIEDFWMWQQRVVSGSAAIASASLLYAGRRLFIVQALAVPFLLATLFAYPSQSVWELVHPMRRGADDVWPGAFMEVLIEGGFATLLVIIAGALGRALPPAPVDVARAGEGLQRVGSALLVRVLIVVVGAFTLMTTFGAHSVGLERLSLVVFPVGLLITSIALVTGIFQTASLSAEGAPRLRLYAAGACTVIAFVAETIRAIVKYNLATDRVDTSGWARDRAFGMIEVLPYFIPAVGLTGLLLLVSAVDRLRRWAPEARADRQMMINAGVAVALLSIIGVVVMREASPVRSDVGFYIMVSILVAIASVLAQVAVARVCHRVAGEMREAPALPTAVVAPRP